MIYTLTLNPAVDMSVTAPTLLPNVTTRTENMLLSPNGKGVNVAFVLRRLGQPAGVLGFFGGFTGRYIVESCEAAGIVTCPTEVAGDTRVNVLLTADSAEYKMVNAGPTVTPDDEARLLATIAALPDLDVLTVNGSTARGCSPDFYDRLIATAKGKGAEVVLDISTPELRGLLSHKPLLIKPNDEELKSIFGLEIDDEASVQAALSTLFEMGAQNVLLTLGSRGSYFYNGRDLYQCGTYPVKLVNSWCTGDGCLAAFLSRWLSDRTDVAGALRLAAATGASIAESVGIGTLENVWHYEPQIAVERI